MTNFDAEKIINRLLTPQKVLSPLIFDDNDKMHEDIRQGLLKIANKIIQLTIGNTNGFEVKDICLTGSLSGYLYHEKSDIDMRIIIKNKDCKDLKKTKACIDLFLSTQFSFYRTKHYRFFFRKKLVDTKITSSHMDFVSLYSIVKNEWLIKPSPDTFKNISSKRLFNYYQKRKKEISDEFEYIKNHYKGQKLCNEIDAFYIRTVLNKPTLRNHLTYKILSKEGVFRSIASYSIRTQCAQLRLENEYKI